MTSSNYTLAEPVCRCAGVGNSVSLYVVPAPLRMGLGVLCGLQFIEMVPVAFGCSCLCGQTMKITCVLLRILQSESNWFLVWFWSLEVFCVGVFLCLLYRPVFYGP